jgi:hypothetical protein
MSHIANTNIQAKAEAASMAHKLEEFKKVARFTPEGLREINQDIRQLKEAVAADDTVAYAQEQIESIEYTLRTARLTEEKVAELRGDIDMWVDVLTVDDDVVQQG